MIIRSSRPLVAVETFDAGNGEVRAFLRKNITQTKETYATDDGKEYEAIVYVADERKDCGAYSVEELTEHFDEYWELFADDASTPQSELDALKQAILDIQEITSMLLVDIEDQDTEDTNQEM